MSLVAWYPLNGDYKNYTGYDMDLTPSGTISYTDGKIGKALHTGGFKWTAEQTANILNNDELSIALWIYVKGGTGSTSQRALIFGNSAMAAPKNRKFSLFQYPDCNSLHWSWQNDVTDRTFTDGRIDNCLPSNEWTHICVTYKNPVGKIYINGELRHTFNGVSNSSTFAYETPVIHDSTYHCLNDYRFYNHCLSESEVKEVSKAKILHYTMSSLYGNKNLIEGTDDYTKGDWRPNGCITVTDEQLFGSKIIKKFRENQTSQNWNESPRLFWIDTRFKPLTKYTFSMWVRVKNLDDIDTSEQIIVRMYNDATTQSSTTLVREGSIKVKEQVTKANEWQQIKFTITTPEAQIQRGYFFYTGAYNFNIEMAAWKVEEGECATNWCPNEIDNNYFDYGSNVEYDISGYGNNGIRTSTMGYDNNRILYDYSSKLVKKNSDYISLPTMSFGNILTINFWGKINSFNSYQRFFEFAAKLAGATGNNRILLGNTGTTQNLILHIYGGEDGNTALYNKTVTTIDNNWHMHTIVISKTNVKYYLDKELIKSEPLNASLNSGIERQYSYIGKSTYSADSYFDGNISDFRIYSTELSDEDVIRLYQDKEKVDSLGSLYCSELTEVRKLLSLDEAIIKTTADAEIIQVNGHQVEAKVTTGNTWQSIQIDITPYLKDKEVYYWFVRASKDCNRNEADGSYNRYYGSSEIYATKTDGTTTKYGGINKISETEKTYNAAFTVDFTNFTKYRLMIFPNCTDTTSYINGNYIYDYVDVIAKKDMEGINLNSQGIVKTGELFEGIKEFSSDNFNRTKVNEIYEGF